MRRSACRQDASIRFKCVTRGIDQKLVQILVIFDGYAHHSFASNGWDMRIPT